MKKWKDMSLLVRAAELILLTAVLILVVRYIPDFGNLPGGYESFQSDDADKDINGTEESADEDDKRRTEEITEGVLPGDLETDGKTGDRSGQKKRNSGHNKGTQGHREETGETEAVYIPPKLIVASDLHFQSPVMTDFRGSLETYTEWNDGTVVPYLEPIADAFLEEVRRVKPSALILSGDLSQNGEKINHQELAKKLRAVQNDGIPVLVIPGNHDINHPWAASYFDDQKETAEGVDAEGFYDIYREFGYDQAASRDEDSLSYLYKLDERYWMMLLDSCIYEPVHETGGRIKKETLTWMREQLEEAGKAGVTVIPVAHHNLLKESTLYPEECTLENYKEVAALLEEYHIPVYISGHLHLQRIKKNVNSPLDEGKYGIYEIVSSSLAIPPCQYGIIDWTEDGSFRYHTKEVDVSGWARNYQEEDENLLNFNEYSRKFMTDIISTQTFKGMETIPEERKQEMAELYADLNSAYCAGTKIRAGEIKKSDAYLYWSRYKGAGMWYDRLTAILRDTKRDHNSLSLTAGIDFPARVVPEDEKEKEEVQAVESGTLEPGTLESGTVESGTLEPGTVEPGTGESGTGEPETVEPGIVEPEIHEPENTRETVN